MGMCDDVDNNGSDITASFLFYFICYCAIFIFNISIEICDYLTK